MVRGCRPTLRIAKAEGGSRTSKTRPLPFRIAGVGRDSRPYRRTGMKITAVRPWIVDTASDDPRRQPRPLVFVEVSTDEGLTGWGEITTYPGDVANRVVAGVHSRRLRVDRREGPLADRAHLEHALPPLHIRRNARRCQRDGQRYRHRALGHQGQGAGAAPYTNFSAARCGTGSGSTPTLARTTSPRRPPPRPGRSSTRATGPSSWTRTGRR